MEFNEKLVQEIVAKVVANVSGAPVENKRQHGVFDTMTEEIGRASCRERV